MHHEDFPSRALACLEDFTAHLNTMLLGWRRKSVTVNKMCVFQT
ncbi:uncharacterized, partial [Tachysurus ichikawai]